MCKVIAIANQKGDVYKRQSYTRLGTTYTFLGWTQVSDPQPGDVAVNAEHCGIYIGGGQMIHAADYGIGVIQGPVQSGMIYVRY